LRFREHSKFLKISLTPSPGWVSFKFPFCCRFFFMLAQRRSTSSNNLARTSRWWFTDKTYVSNDYYCYYCYYYAHPRKSPTPWCPHLQVQCLHRLRHTSTPYSPSSTPTSPTILSYAVGSIHSSLLHRYGIFWPWR